MLLSTDTRHSTGTVFQKCHNTIYVQTLNSRDSLIVAFIVTHSVLIVYRWHAHLIIKPSATLTEFPSRFHN
jgi:hypothetical protein